MIAPFDFRGGIGRKILLMAIIPVLSISVILTWYYIATQRAHLTQDMQRYGKFTADYLAIAGQLAMFANDHDSLQQIARGPANNSAIHSVAFFHSDGSRLLDISQSDEFNVPALLDKQLWPNDQYRGDLFWYFRASVTLEAGSMTDYGEPTEDTGQPLGWAVVALSQEELYKSQGKLALISSVISIFVTLLVTIAASLLSRRIYQPIRELTGIVETMESGDLSVEAKLAGEREIQILARVVNRLASSLNQTNIRLKQEVDEATGDLRQALEDLERALGAKDQFLARMSHELRTPLTTILGFTRRLEHTHLSAEQSEYRHAIQHSSALLLSVINDILDFSRLQYNGITLEEQEFNIEDELEDIVTMHAYSAYEKSLELIMFIDSGVPEIVLGDAIRLKQILNNLLANSVKFTECGEIIIHVQTKADDLDLSGETNGDKGTLNLEFSVQDSGIGIPAKDMEKLFKPFSQADTSINRRFGGSGLGLVICQQLVELMGGQITIDSKPGRGTRVQFAVELKRTGDQHKDVSLPERSDPVAVVDGNSWSRRALRNHITHWTRQVFSLESVPHLIELLRRERLSFAAVLINLDSGAMEEHLLQEALAMLRIHYPGPVILLTNMADMTEPYAQDVVQQYAPLWFLSKPVRRKNLLEWLNVVSGNNAGATGEAPKPSLKGAPMEGCLKGIEILIAEDNRFNQKLFRTMLEAEGATTLVADNGTEAVERFQNSDCSLVLMDAHMPEVDGIEASRQIIALAEKLGRNVKLIGLTADTLEGERVRFLQAGASEVLYKPVEEDTLFEALCRYGGGNYHARRTANILSASTSKPALAHELAQLTANLRRALAMAQLIDSREIIHQLLGLSGMYGMHDFKTIVIELRECLAQQRNSEVQNKLDAMEAFVLGAMDQDDL